MPAGKDWVLIVGVLSIFTTSVFAGSSWQPDLNGDEFVDFDDFAMLSANWQKSGAGLDGDLDNNGIVNTEDLMRFVHYWLTEIDCERADLNYDGIADFYDFAIFADAWLSGIGDENWRLDCDFNYDDWIYVGDLESFTRHWLQEYPVDVIYVDADASPGGDGSSWENAFIYLQDALDAADEGFQIWVAEGVYKPDANSSVPSGTHLRTSTFQLPEGVAVYGGFPAGGCWEYRQPGIYETILSGDIGVAGAVSDNCYNVVVGANDVTIDGFVISDGYADGTGDGARGGGIHNEGANNIKIVNCTFRDNYARYDGGGLYNYESLVFVTKCVFRNNTADDDGGGFYNSNTDGNLTGCVFSDNQAANRGGGMYNYRSGFEVINSLFSGNHADVNGGAVYNSYKAVKLVNCTIAGNSAAIFAGGVYNTYSSSTLSNCIVWDNGEAIYNHSCNPHIYYCDVEGSGGSGAGWNVNFGADEGGNIDVVPDLDGILALQTGSPCIDMGNNFAVPRNITMDIKGNARFNGPVDIGAYEFGQLDMWQDLDSDGMPDWFEYRYELDPNDTNDAQGDIDNDGLSNLGEYENNCDAIYFDTDGDLLADGWEVLYGLNPLNSDVVEVVDGNNVYADADMDGLDTLKEVIYGANPTKSDTDGDGTNDGAEVAQGSFPANASDGGAAPSADEVCELRLTVGDWSDSRSERYDLVVGPITHQAPQFGVVTSDNYNQFRPGERYEVRIIHRGTSPDRSWYPNADYDYVAEIEQVSLPAGVVMQIDDPDGILGTHGEPNTPTEFFDAAGKTAYVNLIKVEIVSVDASDPFNTKVNYRVLPQGTVISSATFIAPGKTETKYNLSGEFYFTYNQNDAGWGLNTIRLEYGDSGIVDCDVTKTSRMPSDAMEVLGAYFMVEGVGQRVYNHSLRETYNSYTYSTTYSGKTINTEHSTALIDFGQDYDSITEWTERHKYSWSGGESDWVEMTVAEGLFPPNTAGRECSTAMWCIPVDLGGIAECIGLLLDYGGGTTPGIITNAEVDRSMPE
ncbi:MAG: choice-of-anchor Q domain-containing protein [Phycisphaerae bacterium]|nr:choice-of-anchor Q domain-containing protein [Phycisphaerae bacterium]